MSAPLILGCAGTALAAGEGAFFREADPWGFILFARNGDSPEGLRRLTGELREAVGREAPVLVDQEGGRVQRFRAPHFREHPPALDMMQAVTAAHGPEAALEAMELRSALIAAELAACGIDVNCAPLADLVEPETHPVLRNRLYGDEPAFVVAACRAALRGMAGQGVLGVLKHVPGYGRASLDGHLALSRLPQPLDELDARDFAPFRALADAAMAMTAHIVVEAIDPERPATTSPAVMRHIREAIGLDGLIMTDDISMEALDGPVAERGAAALAAGCDVVLHCNADMAEMAALAARVPAMTEDAARRAEAALAARRAPSPFDADAAAARLVSLGGLT